MTTGNILHTTEHYIMYHHGKKGNAILYLKATVFSLSLSLALLKVCYQSPCIIHHTVLYITFGYSQIHEYM